MPGLSQAQAGNPSPSRLDTDPVRSPQQADSAAEPKRHPRRQEAQSPPSSQDTLEIRLQLVLPGGLSWGRHPPPSSQDALESRLQLVLLGGLSCG